jgi:hypothetical protein
MARISIGQKPFSMGIGQLGDWEKEYAGLCGRKKDILQIGGNEQFLGYFQLGQAIFSFQQAVSFSNLRPYDNKSTQNFESSDE